MLDTKRKQGENWDIEVNLKNSDGSPLDLTDCILTSEIRNRLGELVARLEVVSDPLRIGRLTVKTGDTSQWEVGVHEWDVCIEYPDGRKRFIPRSGVSKWEIIRSVTK